MLGLAQVYNNSDHCVVAILELLRGSLPKSVPLDFGLEKTFAS